MKKAMVYLIPDKYEVFKIVVSSRPIDDGVFFFYEGKYPTEAYYYRRDMNGDLIAEKNHVHDRNELIHFISNERHILHKGFQIWDVNKRTTFSDELHKLLYLAYKKQYDVIMN